MSIVIFGMQWVGCCFFILFVCMFFGDDLCFDVECVGFVCLFVFFVFFLLLLLGCFFFGGGFGGWFFLFFLWGGGVVGRGGG